MAIHIPYFIQVIKVLQTTDMTSFAWWEAISDVHYVCTLQGNVS